MSAAAPDSLEALLGTADGGRVAWWRRRSTLVVTAIVLVVVLIGAFATGALGSSGASYRTATVAKRTVDSELTSVATIEPVSQASVGFPTSGTVKSVSVQVGDQVAAGADLAQLDTASLEDDLHSAQATLAQAQLTLANGLNGQKASSSPTGGSGGTGNTGKFSSTATGSRIVLTATSTDPELAAAQQAVLQAQQNVDTALATASTAYENAVSVCSADPVDATACQDALDAALDAQKDVQTAQNQLVAASVAYDTLLSERAAQSGGGSTPSGGSTPAAGSIPNGGSTPDSSSSQSSGGSLPSGGNGSATSQAPSSADLVSYQSAVDAAAAKVAVAQQALDQATITTPIAGKVVSVNLTVGESVSDASTQNVIVQGAGGFEATTTIGVDDVAKVKVGHRASVVPDGSSKRLEGKVATISAVPISSASTDYRVTIALDDPAVSANNGSTGTATIVAEQSATALAVPTSAISGIGGRHFVTVDDGGSTRQVAVQIGVVGREWTSVTSGLTAGQDVVLADLDKALPSSATQSSGNNSGSNFPGGGGNFPNFRVGRNN